MRIVDVGSGTALVLIPGIQGRWEWMRPSVDALARHFRVLTASLPGEPGAAPSQDPPVFAQFVDHVDRLMDAAHVTRAVVCGVSFGGLIALRYAALRQDRVSALVLVSTPGPRWTPSAQQARYIERPLLTLPLFLSGAVDRALRELRVTYPDLRERLAFCARSAARVLAAPGAPWRMAARAQSAATERFEEDCARIVVPTLVISGDRGLDTVVDDADTQAYVAAIAGAHFHRLAETGHMGTLTRPDQFAAALTAFSAHIT